MKQAELKALLYLLNAASGPPCLRPLMDRYGSATAAWRSVRRRVRPSRLAVLDERVEQGLDTIEQLGVEVITLTDARYPSRLVHLEDNAPYVLFARGSMELTERKVLGVVGSRRCSEYGIETARALTTPVARAGGVIVSGLALGIDSVAHVAALDVGGDTIAVLGCGIDVCYPPSHRRLFEKIATDGLLLSEFAPGAPPLKHHFPHRNRIIAMLSHTVLVVEATHESGSLSTAARARDYVTVFAVPGPIGRPNSEGCNALIRDGCSIALSAADLLDDLELELPAGETVEDPFEVDEQARRVMRVLSREGLHVDEVAARVELPTPAVTHSLLQLELAGHVRQLSGYRFALPHA